MNVTAVRSIPSPDLAPTYHDSVCVCVYVLVLLLTAANSTRVHVRVCIRVFVWQYCVYIRSDMYAKQTQQFTANAFIEPRLYEE